MGGRQTKPSLKDLLAPCRHDHPVLFYETDGFLAGQVADHLLPALLNGGSAIVVATPDHRDAFDRALADRGVDVETAAHAGRYMRLDAANLLETFLGPAGPEPHRFNASVVPVLDRASGRGHRPLRVFGEMVALLWAEGQVASALALEDLWNDLAARRPFARLCAYPLMDLTHEHRDEIARLCDQHSSVVLSEGFPAHRQGHEHQRAIANLQLEPTLLQGDADVLRAHEAALQSALLEALPYGALAVDREGRWVAANQHFLDLWEIPREIAERRDDDLALCYVADRVSADDDFLESVARIYGQPEYEGAADLRLTNGRIMHRYTAPQRSRGEIVGRVWCFYDVTEERAADERRQLLAAIVESTDDAIYAFTADLTITAWNPAAERLYGYSAAEATGRDLSELIWPPELRAETAEMFRAVAAGKKVEREETQRIRKDGSVVQVALTVSTLEMVGGAEAVVIARDITERKTREEALSKKLEALSWAERVRNALAEDRFVLWAQPIIDLRTAETVQHELLIRMLDRDGEVIPPGAFLPAAEEHGLIGQIDRWVVSEAVELAVAGLPVEVNLSAQSISEPTFLSDVEHALRDSGADPAKIVFEITETALMEQLNSGIEFARRLSALGCGFALDDFGTGFGGFTYLKQLPVDTLKIDIEFVRDLASDAASRHVVQAVVGLAQGFDLKTVAEGVEDEETLALLREFGVDYAQGYHLGRPAPLAAKSAAAPEEKAR